LPTRILIPMKQAGGKEDTMKPRFVIVLLSTLFSIACSISSGGGITPQSTEMSVLALTIPPVYTPGSTLTPTPVAISSTPTPTALPTRITAQTTAKNYYVDPVNGDDENSGTLPQDAWRTLRNVYSYRADYTPPYAVTLEPGDTIYLMDGVHSTIYRPGDDSGAGNGRPAVMRFRDVHGTQANPIHLLVYPGHHPVIDPDYQGEGLYILDSSWLEIGGIEFRHAMSQGEGGNIAIATSSHIEIHDVEVHGADGADDDNISGLNATDVWDLEIYNCSFHDNYDRTAADTGGISTHNSTNMVFFLGGNISAHDCLIYQSPIGDDMNLVNSGMGIKYKHASADPTAYFRVYNNVFRNNKYWAFLSGTANTHFHHNIIIGGSGLGAGSEDCGGPTHQTHQVYEYNTFYQVYSEDRQYSAGGFYFYPTIEWRNTDFPADPSQIVFRRNIVHDDQDYQIERATTNIYSHISDEVYNATAPNMQFDDNCYYNPNYDLRFSFAAGENQGSLGGYYTFDEWRALTWVDPSNGQIRPLGYDVHSVAANPQFISIDLNLSRYDPASNAFRPASGSGCGTMGAYAGLTMPNLIHLPLIVKGSGVSSTVLSYTSGNAIAYLSRNTVSNTKPLGFPRDRRRVVVPAQPPAPRAPCPCPPLGGGPLGVRGVGRTPCPRLRAGHPSGVSPPLCGGGPLGVTGVATPVVMAAPITADKSSVARLWAGSARGMACRQSRSTV